MERLGTVQARSLEKAMREARKVLDDAYETYQHVLVVSQDAPDASEEEMHAIRQTGRAYAQALTQYSNATMAWLTYVDAHLRPKRAGEAH